MIDDDWEPAIEVPATKVIDYLLDPDHPKGGPKARFFLGFGFSRERPEEMAAALIDHLVLGGWEMARLTEVNGYRRMIVEGWMRTPDGRNPHVRTVWQDHAGRVWRLVTAVPLTRSAGAREER